MALYCPSSNCLLALVHILSFAYPSFAQNASSTQSAAPTPSGPSFEASTVGWSIPLSGLEDDPEKPWGVNISADSGRNAGYNLVPIAIGSNMSVTTSGDADNIVTFPFAVSSVTDGKSVFVSHDTDNVLPLNNDSSVGYERQSQAHNAILPTVPFCLNLGRKGMWNGSLTLGDEFYDRNRIWFDENELVYKKFLQPKPVAFASVPDANRDTNSTFMATGKQRLREAELAILTWHPVEDSEGDISFVYEKKYDPFVGPVILDFNSEFVTLPSQDWCGQNVSFSMLTDSLGPLSEPAYIRIPHYLTESPNRCKGDEQEHSFENPLVLGKPFFQSANVLITSGGREMYLAPANTWNLPPSPEKITDMGSVLQPQDPSLKPPEPRRSKNVGAIAGGTVGGVVGLALIGVTAFLLYRRRAGKKPPAYAAKSPDDIPLT